MTDTLGEDRLLDLGEIERAVKAATPGPWKRVRATAVLVGDGGGIPQTKENAELIAHAPDWLARLCDRVRHLEAEVEHEHSNATAILRKYEEAIADADRAELASQRLTEALRVIAEYNVGANHGAIDEWTESAAFHDCKKLAQVTLGAGAPPEDAR